MSTTLNNVAPNFTVKKIHLPTPNRKNPNVTGLDENFVRLEEVSLDMTLAESQDFLKLIRETQMNKMRHHISLETVLEDLEKNPFKVFWTKAFKRHFNTFFMPHCMASEGGNETTDEIQHRDLMRSLWVQFENTLRTPEDANDPMLAVPPWERVFG